MDGFDKLGVHSEREALLELVEGEQLQFWRVENKFESANLKFWGVMGYIEQANASCETMGRDKHFCCDDNFKTTMVIIRTFQQFRFLVDMTLALIRMTWRLFSMMMEDLRLLTQYRPYFRISFCCSDWKSFLGIQFGSQQPVRDPHQKLTSQPLMGQTIVKREK